MRLVTRDCIVVLGLLAGLLTSVSVLVYLPQARELKELRTEIASQKLLLDEDASEVTVVPKMLSQVRQMKSQYKGFDRRLPRQKELGGFLREISANLAEEKLFNSEFKPGNPTRSDLFNTLPIDMQFQGSFLSLVSFLKRVEKMERLTRVQELNMGPFKDDSDNRGNLEIKLRMNIYFTES